MNVAGTHAMDILEAAGWERVVIIVMDAQGNAELVFRNEDSPLEILGLLEIGKNLVFQGKPAHLPFTPRIVKEPPC